MPPIILRSPTYSNNKMLNKRNILLSMLSIAVLLVAAGCTKPERIRISTVKPEVALKDQLQTFPFQRIQTLHLYSDTVYILSDLFRREAGEILIIEAGTLIKVNTTGPTGGILDAGIIIEPGGIIDASGTSSEPIVFTSNAYTGTQRTSWNGLTIKGKSSDNASGLTGDAADFSGTLKFARVEFAPVIFTSVGNKTVVDHLQVSYSGPANSFEFQGGTLDAHHLISYACGGPADFYFTRGFSGNMQFLLALRHPFFGTVSINNPPFRTLTGLLIENNPDSLAATSAMPVTFPKLSNATVLGPDGQNGSAAAYSDTNLASAAILTTRSSTFAIRNSILAGFPAAGWILDDPATAVYFRDSVSSFSENILHSNTKERIVFLAPGTLPPYNNAEFTSYVLGNRCANRSVAGTQALKFSNPYDYNTRPDFLPGASSPALEGARFNEPYFADIFFGKTEYVGAFGSVDWTEGWSNFLPLKTNYNFPQ